MAVSLEKIQDNTAEFKIEVDSAKFEEGINKAFLKNASRFSVPGFRKGKAPRKIIEQYYGEGIFYEDAINIIFPEVYDAAVQELKIEPVDRPEVDIDELDGEKGLVLSVKVTVKPEVKLGKYQGIEIKKVEYNVTDEDVEAELKRAQDRNARIITVDSRSVQEGDIVTIDFQGFKDGEPFEGGEGKGYELTIGSGQFIPGFEEQLIGKEAGAETEVKVTFPEDYHAEDLKGADAVFKVKIHSIKTRELPALDDEFAKDISEFDTLEEYKNDLKAKLEQQAERRQKNETENMAVEAVVENAEVDIPQCMIDERIEAMIRDYEMSLMQQGINLDRYFEITQTSMDDLKKQFDEQAKVRVKTNLVLEAIVKAENIEASKEEVEEEYASLAEAYNMNVEDVKKYVVADELSANVKFRKVVEMIVAKAKVK